MDVLADAQPTAWKHRRQKQ